MNGFDTFLVSMSSNFPAKSQIFTQHTFLPDQYLQAKLDQKYFISSINTGFLYYVVLSEWNHHIPIKQIWFVSHNFPILQIERGWEKGLNISHLTYCECDELWTVVMSDKNYPYDP